MNEVTVFNNTEFGSVRTVRNANGSGIWFVAADVCAALDLSNTTVALDRLDIDEKSKFNLGLSGGATNCVNEYGLYSLVLTSRKPSAKIFKRWITHSVIPSIREHGAYMTDDTLEKALTSPDFLIQLATQLKQERERGKALEVKISSLTVDKQIMQPKADYFDELVDRNLLTGIRETAKELQVKPKMFVNFLLEKKYLYRDNKGKLMPYAKHIEAGLFELKEFTNEKTGFSSTQTFITPKGKETFRLLLIGK